MSPSIEIKPAEGQPRMAPDQGMWLEAAKAMAEFLAEPGLPRIYRMRVAIEPGGSGAWRLPVVHGQVYGGDSAGTRALLASLAERFEGVLVEGAPVFESGLAHVGFRFEYEGVLFELWDHALPLVGADAEAVRS